MNTCCAYEYRSVDFRHSLTQQLFDTQSTGEHVAVAFERFVQTAVSAAESHAYEGAWRLPLVAWRETGDAVPRIVGLCDASAALDKVQTLIKAHPDVVGTVQFRVDDQRYHPILPRVSDMFTRCSLMFAFSAAGICEEVFDVGCINWLSSGVNWHRATRQQMLKGLMISSSDVVYTALIPKPRDVMVLSVINALAHAAKSCGPIVARNLPGSLERSVGLPDLRGLVRLPRLSRDGYCAYSDDALAFCATRPAFDAMLKLAVGAYLPKEASCVVAPADRVFATYTILGSDGMTKIAPTRFWWHHTAHLRWPFNHEVVLDVCIALHSLALPPYVLLEIVDRLPHMAKQNHVRKIRLIEAVRDSIWRIRPALKIE